MAWQTQMPKILIIEDDPATSKLLSELLARQGYKCATAAEAQGGLDIFYRWRPDLCIIDYLLPGKDGSSLCKEIKASKGGRDVAVILVSAVIKSPTNRLRMKNASDADQFLFKPINAKELLKSVEELVYVSPWVGSRLFGTTYDNTEFTF